jgi:quercetin dioxygenase-like cupin family protein
MEGVRVRHVTEMKPAAVEAVLRGAGLAPFRWGNAAGYHYPPHRHDYDSVVVCVAGSITFHVAGTDIALGPGDRIDLAAGIEHAATVGAGGVECVEGTR